MKRYILMMAAVGTVLLLAGCGSAAPEKSTENRLFAANGPALTVVEKQPDQYTADPDGNTAPPAQDGVDFIPDRLVRCADGGLAYYSSAAGDLVYCSADFSDIKALLCEYRIGTIMDARWIDADRLMFLQGNDSVQAVYLFRPTEKAVELLYQPPEGRQILGIEIDENGQPVCILSTLPQVEESIPVPENGEQTGTVPDEGGASNAKDWGGSLWEDTVDERTELGDLTSGEETTVPSEKVELEVTTEP